MRFKPTGLIGDAARHRLQGAALVTAIVGGLGATGVMLAQAATDEYSAEGSDVTTYPDPKTTGDRGEGQVYEEQKKVSPQAKQAVQRAPEPRTAGDRGKGTVQRGQEVYMGRHARRAGTGEDVIRGTAGDRGVGQTYTQRAEETQLGLGAMQQQIDDMQATLDEMQVGVDESQAMLDEATGRGMRQGGAAWAYRPDVPRVDPRYSGDTLTAPPPRTSGDRGRGTIQRGERRYSERLTHEREPGGGAVSYGRGEDRPPEVLPEYVLVGIDAEGRPIYRGPRNRVPERLETPQTAREPLRYYPAPGTTGDRGVGRVYQDPVLSRAQSRIDREQRLLDRQQRRIDRLQRELDRQVERVARRTAGDRGVGVVSVEQSPTIQETLEQLFSQLDSDGDGILTMEEAGRLTIVQRNYADLDNDKDGKVSYSEFTDIVEESEAL